MTTLITTSDTLTVVIEQLPDGHYLLFFVEMNDDQPTKKVITHSIEEASKIIERKMLDAFFKPVKESVN